MDSRSTSGQTSPDEFLKRLKELVSKNIEGNTQLLVRFSDFLKEASGAVSSGRGGEQTDVAVLLSRWLDFNLAIYSVVSTQGIGLLNELLSAAQNTLLPKAAPPPEPRSAQVPRVELHLSGRHGERATTSFVIENHFSQPLAVTFESSMLNSLTGPALPASTINFEPTTLMIAPHGQGVARVVVTITPDFAVGQTYTATIRPLGFGAKELGLSVTVLPPAEAPDVSHPSSSQLGHLAKAKKRDTRRAK